MFHYSTFLNLTVNKAFVWIFDQLRVTKNVYIKSYSGILNHWHLLTKKEKMWLCDLHVLRPVFLKSFLNFPSKTPWVCPEVFSQQVQQISQLTQRHDAFRPNHINSRFKLPGAPKCPTITTEVTVKWEMTFSPCLPILHILTYSHRLMNSPLK